MDLLVQTDNWLQAIQRLASLSITLVVVALLSFWLGHAIYNLFLHPLRSYPGPLLWRASRLPWDYHAFTGTIPREVAKLHSRYGHVVRIAPDELSYSSAQAWKDIFAHRPGKAEFPKEPMRQQRTPNGAPNILNAGKEDHARFRRLLAHAFSEKGMREQEGLIQKYIDLLIDRLGEVAKSGERADMVSWYTMTVFDVIGDLSWGEAFNCLRERRLHDWIPAVAGSVKWIVQSNIARYHGLEFFVPYFVSKQVQAQRVKNFRYSREKVEKRIQTVEPRGDFWDRIMIRSADDNASGEGMTQGEMLNNASVLVLGGSETSATTLSGATYLLLKHPEALAKLQAELRAAFKSGAEIDIFSTGRLKYLHAVLEESMRMYVPVPFHSARRTPAGGAMVGGKFVAPNVTVNVSVIAANNTPRNFHRPEAFVPERWLDDAPAEFAGDDRAAMQVFSLGTRNCIGRNLAYAEMRVILARVLYHFDLALDEPRTGDWFDQKAWGVWAKKPLWVGLSAVKD